MVRQRFATGSSPQHEAEQLALAPAPIEAVGELVQVARQMLVAHTVERAPQPGLEVAEDLVAPWKDLAGASGIVTLDAAIVADPRRL